MFIFLVKFTACLAILLLFYKVILERESMHHFKRFYLLGALVASFIIPNIVFTEYVEIAQNTVTQYTQIGHFVTEPAIEQPVAQKSPINWEATLWFVYGIGVLGFGFRFIKHLVQIWLRIRKNPKFKNNFITKVLLAQSLPPHTFFSYIFLNKKEFEACNIPKEVLLHEETHAKQRHSLDILLIELAQVILWFNPLIYLLKSSIKLNHEFLADSEVVNTSNNHTQYQNTLLSYLSNDSFNKHQSIGIANAINYSSIKKRFTVMKTKTSKKSIVLRSFLLLPLIALLLFGFTETRQIEKENHFDQLINMELLENGNVLLNSKAYSFNEIPELLNNKYLKEIDAEKTKVNIGVKEQIYYNVIENLIDEIKKTKIHWIDVTAKEVIMENNQYEENIPIITETIFLKADRITLVDSDFMESVSQSDIATYNHLAKKYNAVPIEKRVIPLKDLKVLEAIYRNMSKAQKEIALPFPECLPQDQKTVKLLEININNKGQLLIQEELVRLKNLKTYLSKLNEHLSYDERKKVVRSIIKVDTKTPKDVIQKVDKILTDYGTATINIVGPKDSSITKQQSATRAEMKEYNGLAKKYNEMDRSEMYIKKSEVSRLKVLYSKMSEKQRADAEPFPDFPPLPPAPDAPKPPKNVSDTDYASNQIGTIIDEQDPYDEVGGALSVSSLKQPKPPLPPTSIKKVNPNQPPTPPKPKSPMEHINEMAKKGATFTHNGKEISAEKAIEVIKNNNKINIDSRATDGNGPIVKLSTAPIQIEK